MKFWAAIISFVSALVAPLLGWVKGRRDARRDAMIEDYEHAEDIRRRAADADQRLRDYDDAGWRD